MMPPMRGTIALRPHARRPSTLKYHFRLDPSQRGPHAVEGYRRAGTSHGDGPAQSARSYGIVAGEEESGDS